jgi:hypothetical protein
MENGEEKIVDHGIEIDSNYSLIQVFNFINQDKSSQKFVYKGVQFWRQDFEFVMSYQDELFYAGEVVDFEEFKEMLLGQKLA